MELIAVTAIIIGLVLIALLKRKPLKFETEANREWWSRMEADLQTRPIVDPGIERFRSLCIALLSRLGLEIIETQRESDRKVILVAENKERLIGGNYLVLLHLIERGGGPVSRSQFHELMEAARSYGALKGIYITNGYFSQAINAGEGSRSIEPIDGVRLGSLLEEFALTEG